MPSKLDEALDALDQVRGLVDNGAVTWDDTEEERTVQLAGGQLKKKTGRRVMTIRIPYELNKRFVGKQIQALTDYMLSLQSNAKAAELQIQELETLMDSLEN